MKLTVYNVDGSDSGRSVTLSKDIAETQPNDHAIWLDVRRIQANARQGTHKAKERSEVAGSTRKLYRQKGTGNARAGSAKSPIRRSGGTIFGPRPRKYRLKVNRKTQRLARRSAMAYKAGEKAVRVVANLEYDAPDTNELTTWLGAHELESQKVLLLTSGHKPDVFRSSRNVRKLTVRNATDVSTLDLIGASIVVVEEGALDDLQNALTA